MMRRLAALRFILTLAAGALAAGVAPAAAQPVTAQFSAFPVATCAFSS